MKLRDVLKPKSQIQIINEFAKENNLIIYNLKEFIKACNMSKMKKLRLWIIAVFVWIISLSLMISGIIAMAGEYFWFPFTVYNNMFTMFINVFWGILWFSVDIFLIVFITDKLINANSDN